MTHNSNNNDNDSDKTIAFGQGQGLGQKLSERPAPSSSLRPWTFVSDTERHKTPVFTVLDREVISPKDGKNKSFAVLKTREWANVLAITPENKVVLVNQYRHGSRKFSLELPGGVADPGDGALEAAGRELREETGYVAESLEFLISLNPNPALFGNHITTFLARGVKKTTETSFDENEETETVLVSLPELKEMYLEGAFDHALMSAAIGYFLLKEKI